MLTDQNYPHRCPTPRLCLGDLYEGPDLRVKEHTELLVELLDLKTLWEEYGVVGDLIVSCLFKIMESNN